MKFLIDNAVSPKVSEALSAIGFDAVHVREYGIQDATDEVIFDRAANEDRILISADTDFAFILSTKQVAAPSVICALLPAVTLPKWRSNTGRSFASLSTDESVLTPSSFK